MKKLFIYMILLFNIVIVSAQNAEWTKVIVDDSIAVGYRVSDTIIINAKHQVVEYFAEYIGAANYDSCVNIFKDVNNFTEIFEYTAKCEKLKEINAQEYIVHFYLDLPWPMPNSDAVYKVNISTRLEGKLTEIRMVSDPNFMEETRVKREQIGYSIYTIVQQDDGLVRIKAHTYSVPVTNFPEWMAKAWFPKGPAKILRNIEAISKQ